MENQILVINPGSTSTKIALFRNLEKLTEKTIRHSSEDLSQFPSIYSQKEYRKQMILDFLTENSISLESIDVFVGRGGLLRPMESGTYLVSQAMIDDLAMEKYGAHASNLGAVLAFELARENGRPSFIVDPVVVDEKEAISRVTGLKGMVRESIFHALNQKAVAKRYARETGKNYENLNLIVAHLGGGISVGLHSHGKVVDVNDALHGDGPFSPERAGGLPTYALVDLCFSNRYSISEIKKMIVGKGGLVSYLGTSSGIEISERIEAGDEEARFYLQAMAYQIVKEIGALYFAAKGAVDAVLITGGLVYNRHLMTFLHEYLDSIVKPVYYPGEDESLALAEGAIRVLTNQEPYKTY